MQLMLNEAVEALRRVHLPSLPEEVIRLKEELNAKYPNTVTIAKLISRNPEMFNHFLKLVNSNLTEADELIKDATAAVNILGLEEIYNIFLASAFSHYITRDKNEREILNFCAKAGVAAAELSPYAGGIARSEAYLAALTQNVGAIFLLRLEREGYEEVFFKQLSKPFSAYREEAELMGTTHCYAGLIAAKKWGMAPEIGHTILLHHDTDFIGKTANHPKERKLVALIMIANYLVTASLGETFVTQEIKKLYTLGNVALSLPDTALKSASQAVLKYSKKKG
ncbi:HD-like signal output (HDOD) domain, no enzymatic activity [Sulfurivirga caldicuralii]|uniref:HD-like signal output (HDOD) domain, no enzymatic activity n=1 Tax=Sulfurivirga caldicuralii TaxID=364032 RepID=A0A1N6DP51_9GAMM|nr:HDOD domain-containing protein [Sulfurivirga caldicuralii]SIN72530.1 HD-like signal output (HDOD) domain, no enzymatic activity [Sulfurivirga caldicuralii]